jgi:hypothetical protein
VSSDTRNRAEAAFRKEQQALTAQRLGPNMKQKMRATQEKTARLRALRLAKEGANKEASKQETPHSLDWRSASFHPPRRFDLSITLVGRRTAQDRTEANSHLETAAKQLKALGRISGLFFKCAEIIG